MKGEKQNMQCVSELRELGAEECLLLQCLTKNESYAQITSFIKNFYDIILTEQKKILQQSGFAVNTRVISGEMKSEIKRIAEEEDGLPPTDIRECSLTDHILFPTDFSENANLAFEYVKEMVAAGAKKIALVHVQDKSRISPHLSHRLNEFNEKDTDRLNTLKPNCKKK